MQDHFKDALVSLGTEDQVHPIQVNDQRTSRRSTLRVEDYEAVIRALKASIRSRDESIKWGFDERIGLRDKIHFLRGQVQEKDILLKRIVELEDALQKARAELDEYDRIAGW